MRDIGKMLWFSTILWKIQKFSRNFRFRSRKNQRMPERNVIFVYYKTIKDKTGETP